MTCKSHPRARAGWSCAWCKEELCPDCVARKQVGATQHDVCTRCGGPAEALRRLRSDTPYLSRLADAWKYPFQGNGVWAIGSAAVVLWLLVSINAERWANAILWAYVFSLIRANANGRREIQAPDFSDFVSDLVMPFVRGAVATAIVWVPAVLYLEFGRPEAPVQEPQLSAQVTAQQQLEEVFGREGGGGVALPPFDEDAELGTDEAMAEVEVDGLAADPEGLATAAPLEPPTALAVQAPRPLYRDPIVLLLVLFGVLYAPMALLIAATGGGVWQMLNPIYVVAYALRIPRDYGIAVGASALLSVASVAAGLLAAVVASLPIPMLAGIAGAAISTYVPFVTARVLGLLLWVHGATLGCLPPDEAWEPLLAGVEPRGAPPAVERPPEPEGPAQPAYERPTALSLDDEQQSQTAYQRPTEISLDEPGLAPDGEPLQLDPAAALANAVARNELEQAVELYRQLPSLPATALAATAYFGIGRTAAFKGDYALAVRALKASIAAGPSDPETPRAYVMLARIHAEKLGDAATAEKVYRFVAHKYPGTEAAKFAQARLAPQAKA